MEHFGLSECSVETGLTDEIVLDRKRKGSCVTSIHIIIIEYQAIFIKQSSRAEAFVEHFIRPVELLIGKENAKRSNRQTGNVDKESIDWQQYHSLDDPPP